MGTIREWKCSTPTPEGKQRGEVRTISVRCSCGSVWRDEPVPADYRSLEYAKELAGAHCGATHAGKAA